MFDDKTGNPTGSLRVQQNDNGQAAQAGTPIPRPRAAADDSRQQAGASGFEQIHPSLVENRLRGMLTDRLNLMAVRHCLHVEEQQGTRRAVGRHAVGFFYADETAPSGDLGVLAGTRVVFESDAAANLFWFLDTLVDRASEYEPGVYNALIHTCNRVEPMSSRARLIGVGVTTVADPLEASDANSAYSSLGMNRPYRAQARMLDGTDLLLQCDGGFLAPIDVRSTHTLNIGGRRVRQWEWLTEQFLLLSDPQMPEILHRLSTLLGHATGESPAPIGGDEPGGGHRAAHPGLRVTGLRLRRRP